MLIQNTVTPYISFVVPVYNTSSLFLGKCINSILSLKCCEYEIIIIDNNSNNKDTIDEINKLKSNNNIIIMSCKKAGVSHARNLGIEASSGKYIVFVDSDDTIDCDQFNRAVSFIKQYNNIDLFVFTHNDIDEDDMVTFAGSSNGQSFMCESIFKLYEMGTKIGASFIRESVWAKIYRKDCIKNILFDIDLKYGEDNLFILNVCAQKINICACALAIYNYRRCRFSVTNKYSPNIQIERQKNLDKLEKFYKVNGYEDEFILFAKDVIFRTFLHLILKLWIFHPNCPMSFLEKRKKALEILNSDPYARMLRLINKKDLKIKEKLIYELLKCKCVCLAYLVFSIHKP